MSSNVGLSTPRGSGTSGYVQRNLSLLRPRDNIFSDPRNAAATILPPRQRRPDKEILEHDRRREIEVKVLELRDSLEDAGDLDEDGVDEKCEELRKKLTAEMDKSKKGGAGNGVGKGNLKMHQVHELAEVKIRESERLRRALGLKEGEFVRDGDGEGNGVEEVEHPMARQERRKREDEVRKEREEVDRLERKKVAEEERRKRDQEMEDEEMERRRREDREAERVRRHDREDDRDRKRKARRDRSDDDDEDDEPRESRQDDRRREEGGHRDRSRERDREQRGSHGEKRRRSRSRSPKRRYS